MVSVFASSVVDCKIDPRSGQTKHYKIDIYCISTKHAVLRTKRENWLAQNWEWSDISTLDTESGVE
jgi:hypothetical protein